MNENTLKGFNILLNFKENTMNKQPYEIPVINKLNVGVPNKFGMQPQVRPMTQVAGVGVDKLIKEYGSPLYVLSEKTIRNTFREAQEAFTTRYPQVKFAWSYKTNYMDAVCRIFHSEGSWAEVVSRFEYNKALENGMTGSQIIFNGPDKSSDDLRFATENGSYIHVDNFDELYAVFEVAKTTKRKPLLAIRVNMDTGIQPKWVRFGFNYENGEAWEALNRIMLNEQVELVGLHTHIGTYIMAPSAYGVAASKLAELAVRVERKFQHSIKYIDMGGGFASKNTLKGAYLSGVDTCPTFDEYAEAITGALLQAELNPRQMPTLILESGRALIDDAGYLLGTVLANKRLPDRRRATIIDIGVNLLFTSFWYDHTVLPAKETTKTAENTTIYGPLCMNIDVIREAVLFPALQPGDNVVIPRIGAYNMTQWMQFITYRPNIVLIDPQGNSHIIRKKETDETFRSQEELPDYLNQH